ncbi:MAG TPA: trehalose-6-phosphate synthase [Bryobacteraceae bacterium]|jgi:trehalose-6-phosphate synthase|nr:trehalose-6-phosphate synthase [Bryobacteraceae bacterium]
MHLSRRLMLSLFGGVALVSMVFALYQAAAEMHAMRGEVERQALVLAESQRRAAEQVLQDGSPGELQALVGQFQNQEQMAGVAIYDANGQPMAMTPGLAPRLGSNAAGTPPAVERAMHEGGVRGDFFRARGERMHILALPLRTDERLLGAIAVFHNVAFIAAPAWRHALTSVAQTLLIVGMTLPIIRWSLGQPLRHMAQWLHDLRTGNVSASGQPPKEEIFRPLTREMTSLATSLHLARAAAEEEARLRDAASSQWTAERLRISMQAKLNGSRLFAVSNREPYEHARQGNSIVWSVPPSGLVTALEPVLRAGDGTWIAHGTGGADKETADDRGRLRVPPDHPQYTLRRVWLSAEEEAGFYFGFANEGIWPLCHIAHTRPVFRSEDWEQYRAVNRKFAAVLLDEMSGEKEPIVLVQDYHFALLPRMLKERRPDARVAIFWHIPWPNPEAFAICPWQRELLDGMLGADLIGFHIQAHCNNFLETVDRALESRIDWEHFAVNRRDRLTIVRPYPISVAFNGNGGSALSADGDASAAERAALFRELGGKPAFLGLGVDRVDYTKGIPERLRGVERLFDLYPEYREKFTFIQIGAPSRTNIKRYRDLTAEVEEEAERINRRFRTGAWKPVVFLNRHHSHAEIQPYYREADLCLVTSLHDGMNLVAKEYIAARQDGQGALILSRFTGASHELADALVVNPYDTDELAQSIHTALGMPPEERKARMQRMRAVVQENNVYRWAGDLIGDLAAIRLAPPEARGRRPMLAPAGRGAA